MKILNHLIAFLSLVSVALLWKYNWILFVVLGVLALILLYTKKSKKELIVFFSCALGGAIAEIIAILFGVWVYANPNLYLIPVWLPLLWGIAGICIGRFYSDS